MDNSLSDRPQHGLVLIEDCAHTMGAAWNGVKSGNFGLAGCFSTQTYKHLNSGEGGLLTSNDPEFMARAIILSGSYMLYERHGAAPPPQVFERVRLETPNMSGRMDNLRAAILLPQLARLDESIERWNQRYRQSNRTSQALMASCLRQRPAQESFVGSSIQFRLPGLDARCGPHLCRRCQGARRRTQMVRQ
jgi:dTDP-4-amino-4,6-dideoxygalactose transaminase